MSTKYECPLCNKMLTLTRSGCFREHRDSVGRTCHASALRPKEAIIYRDAKPDVKAPDPVCPPREAPPA